MMIKGGGVQPFVALKRSRHTVLSGLIHLDTLSSGSVGCDWDTDAHELATNRKLIKRRGEYSLVTAKI